MEEEEEALRFFLPPLLPLFLMEVGDNLIPVRSYIRGKGGGGGNSIFFLGLVWELFVLGNGNSYIFFWAEGRGGRIRL